MTMPIGLKIFAGAAAGAIAIFAAKAPAGSPVSHGELFTALIGAAVVYFALAVFEAVIDLCGPPPKDPRR